ncbi:hypothetical protein L7F22_040430 [Adiantum nelumboides]|nr:hypothetical protein [Adiantum nelumboides]
MDHTGMQSEHIIYAADTLAPFIAMLFNRALAEGLPAAWTMHIIVPIHKSGDPLDLGNYRTIMIGHTLAKLYGAVLEAELSSYAEREGLRAPGCVYRDVHFLLSNKDKLYMIANSIVKDGDLSAPGSGSGVRVLASHSLQEVKKIMVGLGLQAIRVDIGHGASYLILARDIALSREILDMFRKVEINGPAPDFESWEQKQLKVFEELVLGGTQANVLMYFMPFFSGGNLTENMWSARSVFLTSHQLIICIEDLVRFGAASSELVTPNPYFVMETAADIYDLLEVAGFTDDCMTLHFKKTVTGWSTPTNLDDDTQSQQSTVWKFKGVLGEAASKLVSLLHASHTKKPSTLPDCKESQVY